MSDEIETMECDVAIIGGGLAGLSAAIRLAQIAEEKGETPNIMLLEKGSEVGAHILSGAVLEPRALNELIPDWQEKGAPLETPATKDSFLFLTETGSIKLPTPPQMKNHGNYIVSLGNVARWLGQQAEALGVQIFPGFAAAEAIIEEGEVKGVRIGAFGISKEGERKDSYQPPMEIRAKTTIFAEGCRGHISQQLMDTFDLRKDCDVQTYGLGLKELWEIDPEKSEPGKIIHSVGWPMDNQTYGGSFIYHLKDNLLSIGYVVGLDYQNPHLDPYMEFQRFKTHPAVKPLLEGGRRISYGARALNEGGWQSIPKLTMPGAVLVGCAAGFLNVPKIKGSHTAMKSAMLAAEAIAAGDVESYPQRVKDSWIADELNRVRNIRPAFHKGLWAGIAYSALDTYLFRGKAPWTFSHGKADHEWTLPADQCQPIDYPKPDGEISFDRLSSVFLSATNHEEDQPVHLKVKDESKPLAVSLGKYNGPAARYCPAGVYEYPKENGEPRFQINAQNCVHCKTCDIKEPENNIQWTVPEGAGGPNYPNM
jgi:electron-transferring-flavoprotein dehydrogenase